MALDLVPVFFPVRVAVPDLVVVGHFEDGLTEGLDHLLGDADLLTV